MVVTIRFSGAHESLARRPCVALAALGTTVASRATSPQLSFMAPLVFDFSHLSAEERIQLAEDLWDSLPEAKIELAERQIAELDRRRNLHVADPVRGRPWREVLDEIEQRVR